MLWAALAAFAGAGALGCEEGAPASCRQTGICDADEVCDLASGRCVAREEEGVPIEDVAAELAAALAPDGTIHVAARARTPAGLVAGSIEPGSTALKLSLVVAGEGVGRGPDVAVGVDGHPRISFREAGAVRVAVYNGTNWSVETLEQTAPPSDDFGLSGWRTSIAVDDSGADVVAYRDPGARSLKVAARRGGAWRITTADAAPPAARVGRGMDTSLAIAGGRPVVVHRDGDDGSLRIVTPAETEWSALELGAVELRGAVWGAYASAAATAAAGNVAVAFQDSTAGVLRVAINDLGELSVETPDDGRREEVGAPARVVGAFASLAYGERRRPLVAYQDGGTGALMLAERIEEDRWDRRVLDDAPVAGHGIGLVSLDDGRAVVVHRRLTIGDGGRRSGALHVVRP